MTRAGNSGQLARINPDSKPVLYLVLTVTTVISAVAFAVSFAGLAAVSEWAQIPARLSWALPVFIDGAILGFTLMILVFRARGESTLFAWVVLIAFTIISVGANGAHAYAEGFPEDWRTIVGSGLAGLAPAGLAVFIHGIARLLVAPPIPAPNDTVAQVEGADTTPSNDGSGGGALVSEPNAGTVGALDNGVVDETTLSAANQEGAGISVQKYVNSIGTPPTGTTEGERMASNGAEIDPAYILEAALGAAPRHQQRPNVSGEVVKPRAAASSRDEQIQKVLVLHHKGETQGAISRSLGVPRSTVGRWIKANKDRIISGTHLSLNVSCGVVSGVCSRW